MNVQLISKPFTPTSLHKRRIKRLQFVPTVVNTMADKKDIPYKLFKSGKVRDIYEKNDNRRKFRSK